MPPIIGVNVPERVYAMDLTTHNRLVVGTAERHVLIYDLRNASTPSQVMSL